MPSINNVDNAHNIHLTLSTMRSHLSIHTNCNHEYHLNAHILFLQPRHVSEETIVISADFLTFQVFTLAFQRLSVTSFDPWPWILYKDYTLYHGLIG